MYRSLSTGLIKETDDARSNNATDNTDRVLSFSGPLIDKVTDMGKDIAKSIPFAGTAITAIEALIGIAYESYKDMVFQQKVDAINLIISEKISTEDDICTIIGKLAL